MNNLYEDNYPYHAAGKIWLVARLELTRLPDGSMGISLAEIKRIHRAIANEICGSDEHLSFEEFEFLCDVSLRTFKDVADALGLHKSALSKWRSANTIPKTHVSSFLKKWFWVSIFGEELKSELIPMSLNDADRDFLHFAREQAVLKGVTMSLMRKVA